MLKDADLFETLYASISNDKISLGTDPIPQADVEVYVPAVVSGEQDGDLYIFARFFSIDTEEKLMEFTEEFKDNTACLPQAGAGTCM